MAGYVLTITHRKLSAEPSQMYPRAAELLGAFATISEKEIRDKVWNYRMFRYANVRPRPSFSKSERAWKGEGDARNLAIVLTNDAVNRYGKTYAQYVHLAGEPRGNKLWFKVRDYMATTIGPRLARTLNYDMIRARQTMTTTRIGR
jgi:hypothetical protein